MSGRSKISMARIKGEKNTVLLPAAFVLTFIMTLLLYIISGVAPFGDKILIFSDAGSQYISFWSYFRQLVLGTQDPWYALEKTMGGNVIGLLSYYAASPFNLIFALFPTEELPVAVHLILLLKLSCASLTMAIFLKYTRGIRPISLIFTLAYAFCAYNTAYFWCGMWLDGVLLLPLIALGLIKLQKGKAPWLYILSLAAAIISCYYIGFILCVFSVLYYGYLVLGDRESKAKLKLRRTGTFFASSLLAGGLSAWLLLPTLMSMRGGKVIPFKQLFTQYTYSTALKVLKMICPERAADFDSLVKYVLLAALILAVTVVLAVFFLLRSKRVRFWVKGTVLLACLVFLAYYGCTFEETKPFLHKLLVGFSNFYEMMDGMPNIYTGILPLILSLGFFLSPKITAGEKRTAGAFLLILLLSMGFYIPNLIWHGFTENNCFNFRYSFIFSFFMLSIAARATGELDSLKLRDYGLILGVVVLLIVLALSSNPKLAEGWQYACIFAFVLLFCGGLYFLGHSLNASLGRRIVFLCLAGLHIFTMLYPMDKNIRNFQEFQPSLSYASFRERTEDQLERVELLRRIDGGLYRSAIGGDTNGPMMYGYNGNTHFSSTEERRVVEFMRRLGVPTLSDVWASADYGRTRAFDAYFGVKYTTGGIPMNGYEALAEGNMYFNPYALELAFMADGGAAALKADSDNCFDNLNMLFQNTCPAVGQAVYVETAATERAISGLKQVEEHEFKLEDGASSGEIVYTLEIDSSDPLYLYIENCAYHCSDIYVNGDLISACSSCYNWKIICLGCFAPGETIKVSQRLENTAEYHLTDRIHFCYESTAALEAYRRMISEERCISVSDTDSHIFTRASVGSDGKLLVYTIPYDEAWKVSVDGRPVSTEEAFGIFLAVPLDAGEHEIELKYVPPGLYAGTAVSAFCLAALAAAVWLRKGRKEERK